MNKDKQANFRIDEELVDNLHKFFEEKGLIHKQGIDLVMQVIMLNKAMAAVPGRAVEIETFERYLKDILTAYLTSIGLCSDAEACVQEQFKGKLRLKDKTTDELQANKQKAQPTDETEKLDGYNKPGDSENALKAEVTILKYQLEEAELELKHIKDKYEIRLADAQATADRCKELEALRRELEEKLKDSERALTDYKKDAERTLADCQKEADAALMAAKAEAELDTERAVAAKEREMNEKIREVDRENVRLTAKLEQLQAELERLKSAHGESD